MGINASDVAETQVLDFDRATIATLEGLLGITFNKPMVERCLSAPKQRKESINPHLTTVTGGQNDRER